MNTRRFALPLLALLGGLALLACSDDAGDGVASRDAYLDRSASEIVQDALSTMPSARYVTTRRRVVESVPESRRTYARSITLTAGRQPAAALDPELVASRRSAARGLGVRLDAAKEADVRAAELVLEQILLPAVRALVAGASSCEALGDKADDCVIALLLLEVQRCEADVVPPASDAGMLDASAPLDGATPDAATPDAALVSAPQLRGITPTTATAGTTLTLRLTASGLTDRSTVYVDQAAVPTTRTGPDTLEAIVASSLTTSPGDLRIYVEAVAGDATTRSSPLYLRVEQVVGGPIVSDYSPDNGLPGDKVLIIAKNLKDQVLTIRDARGGVLTPGVLGTISWPTAGSVDTVEVTLPEGIVTGPITVSTSLGTFRGKLFNVGKNLASSAARTIVVSSEYNTSNWSRASGADNNLRTSFFTANGDCASLTSCTKKPLYRIQFAEPQRVTRLSLRGNREYQAGYDFLRVELKLLGGGDAVLWQGVYDLPEPDRDLDIALAAPVSGVQTVQFTSLADESNEPGFSEIEVF